MTDRKIIRDYAEQLVGHLSEIDDHQVSIKAILDDAKNSGVDPKVLLKVAKEMAMEASKLAKRLEDEQQLDLFRGHVDLIKRKGLDDQRQAA